MGKASQVSTNKGEGPLSCFFFFLVSISSNSSERTMEYVLRQEERKHISSTR